MRSLINSGTLLLTVVLISFIAGILHRGDTAGSLEERAFQIGEGQVVDILLFGLAMALVSAFVRPVLTAFTGSLIFRTYGLVVIAIDAVVFWLAIELATVVTAIEVTLPEPRLLWLLVLATGFSLILLDDRDPAGAQSAAS